MKFFTLAMTLSCALLVSSAYAGIPPQYLSVPQWQNCTSTYMKKGAEFVCLPMQRPAGCPKSSWRQLKWGRMINFCPILLK